MKKLFLLITLVGCAVIAKGQSSEYRFFKLDIGFGYAIPTASNDSLGKKEGGITFTVQPHFRLSDNLAVGVRIEGAGILYQSPNSTSSGSDYKVHFLISYCATAEYYLSKGSFRPFVGGGVGFFNQSSFDTNNVNNNNNNNVTVVPSGTTFGFYPEVGFEAGHFRMSADYNVLGKDNAGINNSYASIKIGVFFGGGKKK